MPRGPWGELVDNNILQTPGQATPVPATVLQRASGRDEHSIVADVLFVDPARGDYRVKDNSPALALGFKNFPMDQFGVQKPALKAIARTPEIPQLKPLPVEGEKPAGPRLNYAWQAQVRDIAGLGDRSAYGLPEEAGVLVLQVPVGSPAAKAGLQKDDVILGCNGKPVPTVSALRAVQDGAAGQPLKLAVIRKQQTVSVEIREYAFAVVEHQATPEFRNVPLAPAADVLPAKVAAGAPGTANEPVVVLTDGKLARNYGPVFGNGVTNGLYKLDLGAARSITQVNSFSFNQGGHRGRQRFVLYGSPAAADPGWNVQDARVFTPIFDLDTGKDAPADFVATSIRQSAGQALGSFRWLVWAVSPVTPTAGGENTAFQEFQVLGP
jgi:membrane-associated protease RseP (regulator of RpoE activity)